MLLKLKKKTVGVMADDTDIYILLLFHFMKQHLTSRMLMIPTKQGRAVVDIKLTAERLGDMCSELMPAHALTGCDQVPTYYGIGKKKHAESCKRGAFQPRSPWQLGS